MTSIKTFCVCHPRLSHSYRGASDQQSSLKGAVGVKWLVRQFRSIFLSKYNSNIVSIIQIKRPFSNQKADYFSVVCPDGANGFILCYQHGSYLP